MTIPSPLRSRRLRSHKGVKKQQVIVFQIQHEWFALPIVSVKKVIPKSETQGDYHSLGAGLTVYDGKELLVLDISRQVFGYGGAMPGGAMSQPMPSAIAQPANGYLLLIRNHRGDLAGLPIEASPTVQQFAESDMVPLPPNYAARVNIQCANGLSVQSDSQPILFLLNADQLLHTQPLLPPII